MKIIATEQYEDLAAEWQYQMILILKETLKKHKINPDKSKEICGDFTFDFALLQDQGKIKLEDEAFRPVICFEDFDSGLHYNSGEQFDLHEYAFGNNEEAFDG